jgi:hypothetical protein
LARRGLDDHGEGQGSEGLLPDRRYTPGASPHQVG